MVNGALGRSLEYPMYSLGRILKALGPSALWDFLNANPWPYHRPDQRSETLRVCGPSVFWPLVWPWMWPRICLKNPLWDLHFNILLREYIESRDRGEFSAWNRSPIARRLVLLQFIVQ